MNCPILSNSVQFHRSNIAHRKKRPFPRPFACPWVYIPKRGQRPVADLLEALEGISAFRKAEKRLLQTLFRALFSIFAPFLLISAQKVPIINICAQLDRKNYSKQVVAMAGMVVPSQAGLSMLKRLRYRRFGPQPSSISRWRHA